MEEHDTDLSESRNQSSGEEYSTCSESITESSSMTSSDGSDTGTSNVASPNGSRILPSENYIQPIHVSTPNARPSNPNAFVGMRKQGDLLQVNSEIMNGDFSTVNQQHSSNVAQQVSFLVSKIRRMESEIHELCRTVISLMQTMIPTPTYSETVCRRTTTECPQLPPNSSEGARVSTFQHDARNTSNRSNSVQEIPPQETPKTIPVIISRGSNVPPESGKQRETSSSNPPDQTAGNSGYAAAKSAVFRRLSHKRSEHQRTCSFGA